MKDATLYALQACIIELDEIEEKTECQKDALEMAIDALKQEREV